MKKLLFYWNQLTITFWFVPVLIIAGFIGLAFTVLRIDGYFELPTEGFGKFLFITSEDSARSVLSTISGAMIGVAGTVFSVTLATLTLASSQFGSRLIKNFMYVRLNQVVLGTYISTYIYCLIVMVPIRENDFYSFIPSLAIMLAIVAAIINIILLIIFFHNITVSIQAEKIIADIKELINRNIRKMFPKKLGEDFKETHTTLFSVDAKYIYEREIHSTKNGYLQYLDVDSFLNTMIDSKNMVDLYCRPGHYFVKGGVVGLLYSNKKIEDNQIDKILNNFVLSNIRSTEQDIEFSIQQLVEIASRALSKGINDPFTAISCIDTLTSTLVHLVQAEFPAKYRFDDDKKLRVIIDPLEFEELLDIAFDQIRQYSDDSPVVMNHLLNALFTISKFAEIESRKNAIKKHAKMIVRQAEKITKEENDLQRIVENADRILT